jgi:hypothetical protein
LLVDQDDPEKRIADLEHQLADQKRGADLPPGQPPQQANTAPGTGSGSRKPGFGAQIVRVLAIFCVVGGLYFLPVGCLNYTNFLRTQTTATIDHCDNDTTCYGRWSVGGVSQTGQIYGDFHGDHPVGSDVDVHVWRGHAYEGHPIQAPAILLMSGSFVAIATGVVLWWSPRRKYKSR